ncbi:MAG: polysaccharide deacetylase family protein [Myxococcota bacterium]|nr:polysaccharide deacetylase family protein [Myxococcota bacterium]
MMQSLSHENGKESAITLIGVAPESKNMSRLSDQLDAQAFLPDHASLLAACNNSSKPIVMVLPAHKPWLILKAARHPNVLRLVVFYTHQSSPSRIKQALTRAAFALVDQTIVWSIDEITSAVRSGADPDRIISAQQTNIVAHILDEQPRRAQSEAAASFGLDVAEMTGTIRLLEKLSPDKGVNVINYHRILPPDEHRRYTRPQQALASPIFEIQLEEFANRDGFVDLENVRDRSAEGSTGITFDDGYEDNFRVALPALKKWSVPAWIFVVTGQVGNANSLWWDYIGDALFALWEQKSAELEHPSLPIQCGELLKTRSTLQARRLISEILTELNATNEHTRKDVSDVLRKLSGHSEQSTMLSWEQVKEMHASGIQFGSHTRNHVCLDELSSKTAKEEVRSGQEDLEKVLGDRAKKSVALPRGKLGPFTEETLREEGFESVMTTIAGVNRSSDKSLFVLRRDGKMLTLRGRHHPAKMRLELSGWLDRARQLLR